MAKLPKVSPFLTCKVCTEVKTKDQFYRVHADRDARQSYCIACSTPYQNERRKNPRLRRQVNQNMVNARRKLREEVLSAYGHRCACCGEETYEFLTIDHKNNDGNLHRQQIGNSAAVLLRWLKTNNFPKENFQLLCWNCHMCKTYHDRCIHSNTPVINTMNEEMTNDI